MADKEMRRFYNTGEYKGFTKATFYELVQAILEGEELDDNEIAFVADAVDFELEGLAIRKAQSAAKSSVGKKDWRESDYAKQIEAKIMPFLSKDVALSLTELVELGNEQAPTDNGKSWSLPWLGRYFNDKADAGVVVKEDKIVDAVDKKGLKHQKAVAAYRLA